MNHPQLKSPTGKMSIKNTRNLSRVVRNRRLEAVAVEAEDPEEADEVVEEKQDVPEEAEEAEAVVV